MQYNLINKYIKKVTKDMGSDQRNEVVKELEVHILDSADALAAEKNVKVDDAIIRKVILRMGSAEEVASMYPVEKNFSDKAIDTLKDIGRFTLIFLIISVIILTVLGIYIKDLQFDAVTILIFLIIYMILFTIHMISQFKIFSKYFKET
ncbi:MAG: HAAS signaling domain-containing protein [Methanobacterium sp.]